MELFRVDDVDEGDVKNDNVEVDEDEDDDDGTKLVNAAACSGFQLVTVMTTRIPTRRFLTDIVSL